MTSDGKPSKPKTRAELQAEIAALTDQHAVLKEAYAGTCRELDKSVEREKLRGDDLNELKERLATPPKYESVESLKVLSICILVMKNGFSVIGKSAPASPENFNAALGRKYAYEDAVRQIWPLMGFALRDRLAAGPG